MNYKELLIEKALEARKNAYAPYSKFNVGAALLTFDDKIYSGFNIENAAYSVCNCAERTALFRAVFEGNRKFKAIAVVGGKDDEDGENLSAYSPPCGVCRQALREFCDPKKFEVILSKSRKEFKIFTLEELLPESFGPEYL